MYFFQHIQHSFRNSESPTLHTKLIQTSKENWVLPVAYYHVISGCIMTFLLLLWTRGFMWLYFFTILVIFYYCWGFIQDNCNYALSSICLGQAPGNCTACTTHHSHFYFPWWGEGLDFALTVTILDVYSVHLLFMDAPWLLLLDLASYKITLGLSARHYHSLEALLYLSLILPTSHLQALSVTCQLG